MFSSILTTALVAVASTEAVRVLKWEKEVAGIEKRLAVDPPAKGGVVFAGSSSIQLWDLKKSFPDRKYVNVGFGGSEVRDSTHYAARLILPHEPRAVVFYAGDNDLGNKRTAEQVRGDFAGFEKTIHATLPQTRIVYLPVKPSIARWKLYGVQQKANGYVKALCDADPRMTYLDLVPLTLGADGKPKAEFYQKDGLHLNDAGYALWAAAVKKVLEANGGT